MTEHGYNGYRDARDWLVRFGNEMARVAEMNQGEPCTQWHEAVRKGEVGHREHCHLLIQIGDTLAKNVRDLDPGCAGRAYSWRETVKSVRVQLAALKSSIG